jgi:hemerythrin-like domain-containing protein
MCEYCGCQSVTVIAELTDEHDQLRGLGRDLTDAVGADEREEAADIAARMLEVLRPHTAVEERGLFPAMVDAFPDQINALSTDHQRIEAVLGTVADESTQDWVASATSAVSELFEHILKEQDGVFPAALASLTPQQWEIVAAVREAAGRSTTATGVTDLTS